MLANTHHFSIKDMSNTKGSTRSLRLAPGLESASVKRGVYTGITVLKGSKMVLNNLLPIFNAEPLPEMGN